MHKQSLIHPLSVLSSTISKIVLLIIAVTILSQLYAYGETELAIKVQELGPQPVSLLSNNAICWVKFGLKEGEESDAANGEARGGTSIDSIGKMLRASSIVGLGTRGFSWDDGLPVIAGGQVDRFFKSANNSSLEFSVKPPTPGSYRLAVYAAAAGPRGMKPQLTVSLGEKEWKDSSLTASQPEEGTVLLYECEILFSVSSVTEEMQVVLSPGTPEDAGESESGVVFIGGAILSAISSD